MHEFIERMLFGKTELQTQTGHPASNSDNKKAAASKEAAAL